MVNRILHVEDDADIREIAMMALDLTGEFEVVQCSNGPECLKALENFRPDIFLFDVMMPGMDGIQLLDKVRSTKGFRDTPTIFMTARVQVSEQQTLLDAGAVGIISKPFDPLQLGSEILRMVA